MIESIFQKELMLIKQLSATQLKKRITKKTEVIIYRAKDYYKNGKERLRE